MVVVDSRSRGNDYSHSLCGDRASGLCLSSSPPSHLVGGVQPGLAVFSAEERVNQNVRIRVCHGGPRSNFDRMSPAAARSSLLAAASFPTAGTMGQMTTPAYAGSGALLSS